MRRRLRAPLLLFGLTAVLSVAAAGCSSSGGGGEGGGGSEASSAAGGEASGELTIGWIFAGPADQAALSAIEDAFPGRVASAVAEGAAAKPAAAAESVVSQGATLVVSELAGACAAIPETRCVDPGGETAPGANAVSLDGAFWNRAYLLGRAAGLLTKTDTIAYVAAGDSPQETAAVNAFALGCQSGNPNCIVRLAAAPANPAKDVRALTKNADVVATTLADPALCEAAGDAVAVQPVLSPGDPCGNAIAAGDLQAALEPLVQAALDGEWQGGRDIPLGLGSFGSQVPPDVVTKVEERAKEIEGGRNVFAGPLFDGKGNELVPAGQELTPEFLATQWTWLLGGVLPA